MKKVTITYRELMDYGFPEHTARDIIRQAKRIAVMQYDERIKQLEMSQDVMVQYPYSPFSNPRLGIAPTSIVEEILGLSLTYEGRANDQ